MSTDAIVLLRHDHKQIKRLFREFEQAGERATKTKGSIVAKIIEALTVHTYLENEVMYPEVRGLLPELEDAPAEALPELGRLIDGMLEDRAYERDDPEIERELETGREVVARLDEQEDVDPGDIAAAVNAFRAVYEQLIAQHRAP